MAEWLKAHAWKACLPQGNVGSNPTLSAIIESIIYWQILGFSGQFGVETPAGEMALPRPKKSYERDELVASRLGRQIKHIALENISALSSYD
jgi:hypothetical protein